MTEGIAVVERTGTSGELAWRLAPVAVALGSLALGVVALGHRALTTDEAASAAAAHGSLGTVVSRIVHDEPGQAGGLLLLRLAGTIGDSELALRLPFAVAVALAAGLLVVLGTLLLGRVGGLVAGLAFAANAGVIEASREARPTALGLLGVVLATLLFVFAIEHGGGWRWIPYAVVAAALPLTHPARRVGARSARRRTDRAPRAARPAARGYRAPRRDRRRRSAARVDGRRPLRCPRRRRSTRPRPPRPRAPPPDGRNPVLVLAAAAGLYVLFALRDARPGRWRGVLVASLIAAPLLARAPCCVGIAGVHRGARPLCAGDRPRRGSGGATPLADPRSPVGGRRAAPRLVGRDGRQSARNAAERGLAGTHDGGQARARRQRDGRRRAGALAGSRRVLRAVPPGRSAGSRGSGGWVAVAADTPSGAIAAARPVVSTPRYALLRQFRYGDGLRLQHWVRP